MSRRTLLAVAAWLGAALTAILVGIVAVGLVGTSIIGAPGDVLSQADVERALASAPLPPPTASPSPSPSAAASGSRPSPPPSPSPAAVRREFRVEGGFAVAECRAGLARLVSWSPGRGYGVDEVEQGPDDDVSVVFDGPDDDVELTVTCVDGVPEGSVEEED